MSGQLRAPAAEDQEAIIAASVLAYAEAWASAEWLIGLSDFTVPRYRRVVEVCLALPARCAFPETPSGMTWAEVPWLLFSAREWAAMQAGVEEKTVRELWDRMAAADLTVAAERVREATRRREAMTIAADLHNALGSGASLDEVRPLLDRLLAA